MESLIDKDSLNIKEVEHVLIEKVEQLFRDMLYDGHIEIARRHTRPRGSLYEAAIVVLTRVRSDSAARADGA